MSKSFAILVTGSPFSSRAHSSAQGFVEAICQKRHEVTTVFFYGDGVYVANRLLNPANDEWHPGQGWLSLANQYQFPLQACISVANKRGLLNQEDSELAQFDAFTVLPPFEIAGLGAWADAVAKADKMIHFA
jgi:tRNA 2-thiouridine synthesizing protein D